MFAVDSFGYR